MIELVATEQGGTNRTVLDVSQKPIELNVQFWDINKPMSSVSPYSYNFTLPYTRTNDQFFSYYYNCNTADGTFSSAKETDVELYVDGIVVMTGVLQLHSASESEGYTVNVLEEIAKLFDQIKGLTFPQLFTDDTGAVDTDLDHALNWENVQDSWNTSNDITTGAVGDGTIVYPLSDWGQGVANNGQVTDTGQGFTYQTAIIGGNLVGNLGGLNALNMKPAIRIQYLIDYVFQRFGYTVESTFLASSNFRKIYQFLATDTLRAVGRATYGCLAKMAGSFQLADSQAGTWYNVLFPDESAPGYDPDGLMSGGVFTAPYDGVYTFRTQFVVRSSSGSANTGYQFYTRLTIDGNSTVPDQFTWCANQQWTLCQSDFVLDLNAGNTVGAFVLHNATSSGDITVSSSNPAGTSFFSLDQLTTTNEFVDVSENMPNVTVDLWLKAIFERFNLVMVSSPTDKSVITIEPWTTWWNGSYTNRDWTEVVDQDSIKIEPTTKYQKLKYLFTDAPGQNFPNRYWQENFGWVKGQYEYNNTNDFVQGEKKTSDVFQPLRNRPVYRTIQNTGTSQVPNMLLPCFWDWHDGSEGSIYLKEYRPSKPVLAYYNGLQPVGQGVGITYPNNVFYDQYPYFSEFDEVGVDTTTRSLLWGYDYPDNFQAPFISGGTTGGSTQRYAFYEYWSQMMNECYSPESRIMTCKINLDYVDLVNLSFGDAIYLDGCFWRVMSIKNFALNSDSLATAQLIKVLSKAAGRESPQCRLKVDSFNSDGTVNFVNAAGNPVSPTEDCCVLNGFVWDDRRNQCFSRNAGGSGSGGGGNTGGGIGEDSTAANRNIANNIPTAYSDFSRSKVQPYAQKGTIGNRIQAEMYATTTGTTLVNAKQNNNTTEFTIPVDSVIYVRVTAVITEIGGSAANIGDTSTQFVQASVANTRRTSTAQSTARVVGATTTIAENKDTGVTPTMAITAVQNAVGDVAYFTIDCTGLANINMQWFLSVELQTVQIGGTGTTLERNVVYNLDPEISEETNTFNDALLYYNLPLL